MAREKFSTLTEQMFYILLCLRAAKPRLPLLYDSGYSYYPLPLCPSCRSRA